LVAERTRRNHELGIGREALETGRFNKGALEALARPLRKERMNEVRTSLKSPKKEKKLLKGEKRERGPEK